MVSLSLSQFMRRKGSDPAAGVRCLLPGVQRISIRYLLTEMTFVHNMVNGDQVLPRLLNDLRGAQHEINISMFLFYNDEIGKELANVLITKASDPNHTVKVQVLLNVSKTQVGHMSDLTIDETSKLVDKLQAGSVKVLDTGIDYDKVITTGNHQFDSDETGIRNTVSLDVGIVDHRKLITIDGTIGYCGSANFGCEYLYHHPFNPSKSSKDEAEETENSHLPEAWQKWHDGLVRFVGPIVPKLDEVFRERWVLDGGQDYQPLSFNPYHTASLYGYAVDQFQIVVAQPSGKTNAIRELFKQMIEAARESIFIQNPYLFNPVIVNALIEAKKNNPSLRVDLVLPNESNDDCSICYDAQSFRYQQYLPAGINVYEYQNHFNHLKIATFDNKYTIVGSSNLNYRSLEDDRDFELVILVDNPEFARDVNLNVRDVDISRSKQFTLSDVEGFGSDLWIINCRNPLTISAEAAREI